MTGKIGVLLIQRDKIYLALPLFEKIFEIQFPQDVIHDLDILTEEGLDTIIKQFVEANKISQSHVVAVLGSSVCLIKDFSQVASGNVQPKKQEDIITFEENIKTYIEHAPFDHVVTRRLPIKDGQRVCVVTRDFYDVIRKKIEKHGVIFDMVIPSLFFGDPIFTKATLDFQIAEEILKRLNSVKQYNLLDETALMIETDEVVETVEEIKPVVKSNQNKRVFILIGVFGLLLIVLIIVYLMSNQPTSPKKPLSQAAITQSIPTSVPVITQAALIPVSKLNVVINSASSDAQLLKSQFVSDGFSNVTISVNSITTANTTFIIFSSRVDTKTQSLVVADVGKYRQNVKTQKQADSVNDVNILLGQ